MSTIYMNRRVPDVCGLVGMRPRAMYIMLPLQPGDQIDVGNGGGTHPNGDETATNDGWAAFSGTSAAAPQLAGAAALIREACPRLTPAEVRNILMSTARDVALGTCNTVPGLHTGLPAAAGPDNATGDGLVDTHKAAMLARLRCLGPIPVQPERPIGPAPITPPISPIQPVSPVVPIRPISPSPVLPPIRPPILPIAPRPRPPIGPPPTEPPPRTSAEPAPPQAPTEPGSGQATPLSSEDVQALEEMVIRGELDLD
jgi:hypothetical protein